MTNLNRESIGPFPAPSHGWDSQEPDHTTDLVDALMQDDPGIYQDLLAERDEAIQRCERATRERDELRLKIDEEHQAFLAEQVATADAIREADELRQSNERLRKLLSRMLDEVDQMVDGLTPGLWDTYSAAVEALGR